MLSLCGQSGSVCCLVIKGLGRNGMGFCSGKVVW